jgi:pullulanase
MRKHIHAIAGTGIGVFNDRLRDAVRGGSPFDDPRDQGFATGLAIANNANESRKPEDQQENIVYVPAHDNQTLFDAVQAKAPAEATIADRIRMNNLALSIVMFSQGVPFFHAGDDILRSKSFDLNSYNSGD